MIDTLEAQLQSALPDRDMIEAMLRGIDAFERYRPSMPLIPVGYSRTLLHKTSSFELVAMQWAPASVSSIHDHGDSRCWVVVLDGVLDVDNFERRDDRTLHADIIHTSSAKISRGDFDHRLNWRELHRVRNNETQSAYSLQLYSPTIATYTVVNEHTGMTSTVPALYDAIFDL